MKRKHLKQRKDDKFYIKLHNGELESYFIQDCIWGMTIIFKLSVRLLARDNFLNFSVVRLKL